jgi:hypothetical protein
MTRIGSSNPPTRHGGPAALRALLGGLLLSTLGCDPNVKATNALEDAGYRAIVLHDMILPSERPCADGTFGQRFAAVDRTDARIQGIVCCGLWRCTIRPARPPARR